jgi:hypothetical protein
MIERASLLVELASTRESTATMRWASRATTERQYAKGKALAAKEAYTNELLLDDRESKLVGGVSKHQRGYSNHEMRKGFRGRHHR